MCRLGGEGKAGKVNSRARSAVAGRGPSPLAASGKARQDRAVLASCGKPWQHAGAHYVTVSSFVEMPFEFKVVEVDASGVKMGTVSLAGAAGFDAAYDDERAYVQGRPEDRAFDDRTR